MPNQPNPFFEQHQGFARAQAHLLAKRLPRSVALEDILAWAERGLWEAARRFDPKRHNSFTTYAYYRIRGAIYDEVRRLRGLPPRVHREVSRMAGQDDYLENTVAVPAATDGALDHARQLSHAIQGLGAVFLASHVRDEEGTSRIDAVDETDPSEEVADADLMRRIAVARRALPERQREILRLHYEEFRSMTDIADALGVNKATISREHARAVDALKKAAGLDAVA